MDHVACSVLPVFFSYNAQNNSSSTLLASFYRKLLVLLVQILLAQKLYRIIIIKLLVAQTFYCTCIEVQKLLVKNSISNYYCYCIAKISTKIVSCYYVQKLLIQKIVSVLLLLVAYFRKLKLREVKRTCLRLQSQQWSELNSLSSSPLSNTHCPHHRLSALQGMHVGRRI